ncbi:MAG: MoxR family ATPase [Oligosphaeraceae bacterium]|nr:MoxR family ATPase [Oligosphaeraceae bacterium]
MLGKIALLRQRLNTVICGKSETVELLLTALAAGGNVLLHDVPGVGKTTLAKSLAASLNASFRRIQFTPDLLPSDIVGSNVYNPKSGELRFRKGPLFANIILADEINRASPRTQSALLEAMSEKQVSDDGVTYALPRPFMVIATANPIEYQGTYPLPEAQLDRFAMQLMLGYPQEEDEMRLMQERLHTDPMLELTAMLSCDDIIRLQQECRKVNMDKSLLEYVLRLITASRDDQRVALGASPRAALTLNRCAQAAAYLDARDYVLPDDLKKLAVAVLAHRLVLQPQAMYAGASAIGVIEEILKQTPVPR